MLKITNLHNHIPIIFYKDAKRCTIEVKQHLKK